MNLVLATSLYSQVKFLPKIGVSWSSVSFDENINERFEGKVKFGEEPHNYAGSNYYVNPFDFGLQFGAGVKVKVVVIDLRFGLGLTDLIDKRDLSTNVNRSLQLTAGFPIDGRK